MNIRKILSAALFTQKCSVCNQPVKLKNGICDCLGNERTEISENFCEHCAQEKDGCTCSYKLTVRLAHVAAVYGYSGAVRQEIHALKFEGNKKLSVTLADSMSERVARVFPSVDFDFVTFVPSSEKTVKKRGYNQSRLIAERIAENFFLPCKGVLEKVRETPFQHMISADERGDNLIGSITCKGEVEGKIILLCDDVKTTGSTLNECVKVLKEKGAEDVYCICYATSEYRQDIF